MSDKTTEFVRLLSANDRRVYGYIRTLIFNAADVDEAYQNTCVVLWEKFSQFRAGSDFFAWARSVARYEALALRRRRGKEGQLFSEQFYDQVEACVDEMAGEWEDRHVALADCFGELSPDQQRIVELRYAPGATTKTVAEQLDRSTNAIYKSLRRVHETLFECIDQKLSDDADEAKEGGQ